MSLYVVFVCFGNYTPAVAFFHVAAHQSERAAYYFTPKGRVMKPSPTQQHSLPLAAIRRHATHLPAPTLHIVSIAHGVAVKPQALAAYRNEADSHRREIVDTFSRRLPPGPLLLPLAKQQKAGAHKAKTTAPTHFPTKLSTDFVDNLQQPEAPEPSACVNG